MMENELISKKKMPSGIPGFDEIARGGIPCRKTTLVSGMTGSGKTVFAAQFLHHGITMEGENGVFITFEESPEEIIENMEDFGWNLNNLVNEKKWVFVDGSPPDEEELKVGEYNLQALLSRIEYAVHSVNAKRVVIDSVSSLFPRFEDAPLIRRELYRISRRLKKLGVTAIMTAEQPVEEGAITRYGVEEFVSDNVILLHNRLTRRGDRERTAEIIKFRGTGHETNEAPFIVSDHGMEIFPRTKPELLGEGFTDRLSTGIPGLDNLLNGGVFKNSATLFTGASGTGKTTSALHFIIEGAKNNEKCIFIEFEESPSHLFRNAASFGWNLKELVDKGFIQLICHYPEDLKVEQYLKVIKTLVLESGAQRVALDSLSALELIYDASKFREFVVGFNTFLKMHNCTSVLTNTTSDLLGKSQISSTHISTASDNIILLKYVELDGQMRRLISVLKARGSDHNRELTEFKIAENGIEILEHFRGVEGLLSGSARKMGSNLDGGESKRELLQKVEYAKS